MRRGLTAPPRTTTARSAARRCAREIAAGLPAGIALDDGVAASYADEQLAEVVSGRAAGRAFMVDRSGEHPLPVRFLG